jgi:hypothetical protein
MKKIFLMAVAATLFTVSANAQERFDETTRTGANHSVSVDLLGLHYAYELPIGRTATIIGRVGANFGAAWTGAGGGDWRTGIGVPWGNFRMIAPSIDIEPRWYYGLDRRKNHGRGTFGNSGSFLSLRAQGRFPYYISDYDSGWDDMMVFVSPVWGLRRVWNDHWLFEFTAGARLGVTDGSRWFNDGNALNYLDVGVRFGYTF